MVDPDWILIIESNAYLCVKLHSPEHIKLDFIMEAITMNPDQAASKAAVWSRSILFAI